MDLKINIDTDKKCQAAILDLLEGYLAEDSNVTVKGKFKYSETASLSVLLHNKSDGPVILNPVFTTHVENKTVILPVRFDGWFTVNYIVLPTKEWFDREYSKTSGSALTLYDTVYYIDGNEIYKYYNRQITGADLEEVVLRNPDNTTISKICENYVSICFLNKCYISLCLEIFKSAGFNECDRKNTVDADLIYRRDLVWMAINTVKYMVELNQLAEAERIIERIGGCNGLCRNEFKLISEYDCRCGGR